MLLSIISENSVLTIYYFCFIIVSMEKADAPSEVHMAEKKFVEEVGFAFEQTGIPRMAGRIFGWLLVSNPAYQSPDQIATALMASRGSISTMTRLLLQMGLIERVGIPGVRHDNFRIRENALQHLIQHGLEEEIELFHQLATAGLNSLKYLSPDTHQLLEEMHNTYSFLEEEFPLLLKRWEKEHQQ